MDAKTKLDNTREFAMLKYRKQWPIAHPHAVEQSSVIKALYYFPHIHGRDVRPRKSSAIAESFVHWPMTGVMGQRQFTPTALRARIALAEGERHEGSADDRVVMELMATEGAGSEWREK
jgi:hypothetical protein